MRVLGVEAIPLEVAHAAPNPQRSGINLRLRVAGLLNESRRRGLDGRVAQSFFKLRGGHGSKGFVSVSALPTNPGGLQRLAVRACCDPCRSVGYGFALDASGVSSLGSGSRKFAEKFPGPALSQQ